MPHINQELFRRGNHSSEEVHDMKRGFHCLTLHIDPAAMLAKFESYTMSKTAGRIIKCIVEKSPG